MSEEFEPAEALSAALSGDLYDALRAQARRVLGTGSRLDPTELVHEAWARLAKNEEFLRLGRIEFRALCATAMRRVAIDEARRRQVERQDPRRITIHGVEAAEAEKGIDLLTLDRALEDLEGEDTRWARIVELRFFGGLRESEVAEQLKISTRTVSREWALARAWLKLRLS